MPLNHWLFKNGLAIYRLGDGEPVLLFPYPHGYPTQSTAEHPLAHLLLKLGKQVITFDPPGAFRSSRPARIDLPEMLECAAETLVANNVQDRIAILGHSMGGFCALGFAIEHPERVSRLVVLGSVSGGPSIMRNKGMPLNWSFFNPTLWKFALWGTLFSQGRGNLAMHKRELQLLWQASYVDNNRVPRVTIEPDDDKRPAPMRDKWPQVARKLDLSSRLSEIRVPALVGVGRFDPQAPVGCSEELARAIPIARLVIFEKSGHYPFIEEPEQLENDIKAFLGWCTGRIVGVVANSQRCFYHRWILCKEQANVTRTTNL